jgi:hypothetical protein
MPCSSYAEYPSFAWKKLKKTTKIPSYALYQLRFISSTSWIQVGRVSSEVTSLMPCNFPWSLGINTFPNFNYQNPYWEANSRPAGKEISRFLWNPNFLYHVDKTLPVDPNLSQIFEVVSKSFRTGRLERELQMIQLSATRCSYIAILWVSLVSFTSIILWVASQQVSIVVFIPLSTQSGNFWIYPRIYST